MASALATPAVAEAAESLYGVTSDNRIVRFNSDSPRYVRESLPITGLQAGERVLAIDVRPATDQLYALGSTSRVYIVNPTTGTTRPVDSGAFAPALAGTAFGFDVNPVADRIRIVSNQEQNLRFNPNNGSAQADAPLAYAPGDAGAGSDPNVVGSAYTSNTPTASTTQLLGIDSGRDTLVLQNPPNDGTLTTVGPLGVDTDEDVGFDVSTSGTAYAVLNSGGSNRSLLYTVNLGNGAASAVPQNRVGADTRVVALAAGGAVGDDKDPPTVLVSVERKQSKRTVLRRGVDIDASADDAATYSARLRLGGRTVGRRTRSLLRPGIAALDIRLNRAGRRLLRRQGRKRMSLLVRVTDAAGNTTTKRRSVTVR